MTLEDLPDSAFPKVPDKDGLCLMCRIGKARRHSWFCRKECEVAFVERSQ